MRSVADSAGLGQPLAELFIQIGHRADQVTVEDHIAGQVLGLADAPVGQAARQVEVPAKPATQDVDRCEMRRVPERTMTLVCNSNVTGPGARASSTKRQNSSTLVAGIPSRYGKKSASLDATGHRDLRICPPGGPNRSC